MNRSGAALPSAVGRYAMYGQIGSGGMATVHLGRGPGGEVVAIKRLKPYLIEEPGVVESFLDEARLSARVRHPNVVATLDVVTHDDEVFLVMEYIEGVSLAFLLRARAAAVPADLATSILSGALQGLHAAHEAVNETGQPLNIVHRDISPHNILVGVDGTARVLDFGVAKALGRQQTTRDGQIKGKLGYMAPEQLSGRGVTRRTDVFAAGIVLWELLTGRRLFQTDDEATTVTRVLMEPVRAPSQVCPSAPAALDPVVLRALERDPTKRFLSAKAMAGAVDAATSHASAAQVGWWVRSIAADELARRAVLLRAEPPPPAPPSGDAAQSGVASEIREIGETTTVADASVAPWRREPSARRRHARVLGAAGAALAVGLVGWGATAAYRGREGSASRVTTGAPVSAAALEPATPPAPQPSELPPSSPAPPTAKSVQAASAEAARPSAEPATRKGPRRISPKAPPTKPPPTRERLYSRD